MKREYTIRDGKGWDEDGRLTAFQFRVTFTRFVCGVYGRELVVFVDEVVGCYELMRQLFRSVLPIPPPSKFLSSYLVNSILQLCQLIRHIWN